MLYYAYVLCIYYYAYACVRNTSQRDIYGTVLSTVVYWSRVLCKPSMWFAAFAAPHSRSSKAHI